MSSVRHLRLSEEAQIKWKEAVKEFNALKVQILIDNDFLPENAVNVLDLERLQSVLDEVPVPSRVYVDRKVYKIKLRKRVEYSEYKEILEALKGLGKAWWDKQEKVIKVLRYEEASDSGEEEVPEVPVYAPDGRQIGTMKGGGV